MLLQYAFNSPLLLSRCAAKSYAPSICLQPPFGQAEGGASIAARLNRIFSTGLGISPDVGLPGVVVHQFDRSGEETETPWDVTWSDRLSASLVNDQLRTVFSSGAGTMQKSPHQMCKGAGKESNAIAFPQTIVRARVCCAYAPCALHPTLQICLIHALCLSVSCMRLPISS